MKKVMTGSHLAKAALIGTMAVATLSVVGCATKPTYQSPNQLGPKIITNAQGVPNYLNCLARQFDGSSYDSARQSG